MGEDPRRCYCTGCPSIDLAAAVAAEPGARTSIRIEKYGGVGTGTRPVARVTWWSCSIRSRPSIERARKQVHGDAACRARRRDADAVVLAQRRRRLGRHLEGDPRLPRARERPRTSTSSRTCCPRTSCGCSTTLAVSSATPASAIRECSFLGVPAVNLGTRQSGRERGPNVLDVGYDRREIADGDAAPALAWPLPGRSDATATARAGKRIADLLAEVPLKIEKRLAY